MTVDPYAKLRAAVARFAGRAGGGSTGGGGGTPRGMMRVTIRDDSPAGGKGFDRLFDAFEATVDDLPGVMRDALPAIRDAHRAVFQSEGAAGRGPWPALSPRTIAERRRLGFGPGPILVRTGQLRDHVLTTPAVVTRRAGLVELRIAPAAVVGGVPKYVANAMGTSNGVPSRPMVAVGPAAAAKITSAIRRSLAARAAANGLR